MLRLRKKNPSTSYFLTSVPNFFVSEDVTAIQRGFLRGGSREALSQENAKQMRREGVKCQLCIF